MQDDYQKLVVFWNQSLKINKEELDQAKNSINPTKDWESLAPSPKLIDALKILKDKEHVLDYGCGNGWASIVLAKLGCKRITAVEVAPNAVDATTCYLEVFGEEKRVDVKVIDEAWIKNQVPRQYDGFYCSNVIDVIPLAMAKDIISSSYQITTPNAKVIFSTNYYIDPLKMQERGFTVKDSQIYIDGILRLNSLTDEEWIKLFKEYYKEVEVSYFAWPGEDKEARRIFILSK